MIPIVPRPVADRLAVLPPLAVYVHFPWCLRKCPYCDFNSHEVKTGIPEAAYLDALLADLEAALPQVWGRSVISIFIGGGTPSLLSVAGVDRLLAGLRARLPLLPEAEVTLEANPGAIEAAKFAGFRAAGVNRLSLGIQSFDDAKLRALGRIHGGDEARRAAELALRHFERVNFDLMYGLPGQDLAGARHDLATAIALGPGHLSAYHLTLEPNTAFHHAPPPLPDDDLAADMQEMAEGLLAEAGYRHYETSAFARPGQDCRHNLNYWTYGDYLGLGAGAHGKVSQPERIWREMRHKHPSRYLAGTGYVQDTAEIGAADRAGEFMMNALRLVDGFPPGLFAERTGLPDAVIAAAARQAQADGLLEIQSDRIRPTLLGQRHLNALIGRFFA